MITNYHIFNLSKASIKRKIPTDKVQGVTVSKKGPEFVIHIPEEYDYRYSALDLKFISNLNIYYFII